MDRFADIRLRDAQVATVWQLEDLITRTAGRLMRVAWVGKHARLAGRP